MRVLLLLDFQQDFSPFGALPVAQTPALVAHANALLASDAFQRRFATQNWHSAQHRSFAANHYFRYPGQVVEVKGGVAEQRLWPIYGVADSFGAELLLDLDQDRLDGLLKKGQDPTQSAYSAFGAPELAALLQGTTELHLGGFFTEYAVRETVLDALDALPEAAITVDRALCAAKNWEHPEEGKQCLAELAALERVRVV